MTDVFKTAYRGLNSAQKEAVDTTEGPVMVIAGPGTGKTQILTLRIARILETTDTKPENILALTFTESGARAMRERLRTYVGAVAYRVPIYTFHGFAESLIRQYPDAYTKVIGGRPARDLERVSILETILKSPDIKALAPLGNPLFYLRPITDALKTMKQEYITPETFASHIEEEEKILASMPKFHEKGAHKGKVRSEYQKKEKTLARNRELLYVYKTYDALLKEQRLYDFEDMILETVGALKKNEDMLRDLQETYQYILADEHQDVNGSQNEILELLASYHESPNIFVVGDEKQAIYRFQGASLENFLFFQDRFQNTKVISLIDNYRSGQTILDASHSLIKTDEGPAKELRVPLTAKLVAESRIERRAFSHQAVEDDWVVSRVQQLCESDVLKNEIAVIVRTNREVEEYTTRLRKMGVPVTASADSDILSHRVTHTVRALIEATLPHTAERGLFQVLHAPYWGIETSDLVRVLSARNFKEPLSSIILNKEKMNSLGVSNTDAFFKLTKTLMEARELETHTAPHRVVEYLVVHSGFLSHLLEHDPLEGGRVIRRLYDEIEELVARGDVKNLRDIISFFDMLVAHNLSLDAPFINTDAQSVQVLTAHKSKGLEFEHVFIPHLTDSGWGGRRNATYFSLPLTKHIEVEVFDALDDERRLLYVSLTRAKKALYMSSSDTNAEGREFVPSRFFEEIDPQCIESMSTQKEEGEFDTLKALQATHTLTTRIDSALLLTFLTERGLSATALNNYLQSPWDYFYRNVLRVPEIQELSMLLGTGLHGALEKITAHHTKTGVRPTDTEIKYFLDQSLERLPITKEEFTELHERGFEALLAYTDHMVPLLPKVTKEEFSLRVSLKTGNADLPEVILTGKLDRLDFNEEGKLIRVVDYKSGKIRTKGQIEGTTKDSNGNYKRQLVFYALLLSLYEDERYQCRDAVISFIEPDAHGKIKEFSYTITDTEIEELKNDIIRVASEIATGAFLNAPVPPDSPYAHLVRALRESV